MTKALETCLLAIELFNFFIIYIVVVFFPGADCSKLLSKKVSILILESNSLFG